jgi:hypothetical protein
VVLKPALLPLPSDILELRAPGAGRRNRVHPSQGGKTQASQGPGESGEGEQSSTSKRKRGPQGRTAGEGGRNSGTAGGSESV